MSIEVMSWVWKHSKSSGTSKFVLLAIADNAWDDGTNAWPSITTISRKTGLSSRTVQRCIQTLCEMGELEWSDRPGHSNLYRVLMNAPIQNDKKSLEIVPVKNNIEIKKKDDIWDAVMEVCGVDKSTINSQERGRHNKAVKALRESGATPEDIVIRASIYKMKFPNVVMTPIALASHWSELNPENTQPVNAVPAGWDAIKQARMQRGA